LEDGLVYLSRVHGVNERIGVEDHARMIAFYADLLRSAAGADNPPDVVYPAHGR
jgi:acetylornithine deacetylase/succinyl-diaminopimelate desuccinylase-like protein